MKRHVHAPVSLPTDQVAVSDLTTVELPWLERRIENHVRFGRPVSEKVLDRNRRVLSFAPGSVFAFVRWTSNDFGTVLSRVDILRAAIPGQRYSTVPWINPGGEILLRLSGWPKVERAVMQIESAGDEHATSRRGAMGLMQIMPGTWVELSVRYGLGLDPYDPHDNILAGAAYPKQMHDRFGSDGFLAAYHAGPLRYEQHLATGRPLPPETEAYVSVLTPLLASGQNEHAAFRIRHAIP